MINLDWVKDYIDIDGIDVKELAERIKTAGINIENVITKDIDGVVVGKVLSCIPHPNSDHMHICKVDVGDKSPLQIVCGAPNIREGIKVIVAKVGAHLPDGTIKEAKLRGVDSYGMICALSELGLEEKTDENWSKGIEILPDDAEVGTSAIKTLGLADTLYELDVHKHRNNDCYSHIGFAYEIAAILGKKVTLPKDSHEDTGKDISDTYKVNVDTGKCSLYLLKKVSNLNIKESPEFIKNRLISVGMRPINNIVDISNYVMLEYGQPLHFYDADKTGKIFTVRNALNGEKVVTLDGEERELNQTDIVVDTGNIGCIAGVMGALGTDVDKNTNSILIESAIFNPVSIRNTSRRLNLKSEASIRFGKGLNYEYTYKAVDRACYLLEKYADAKIETGLIKYDKTDKTPEVIEFKEDEITKILGIDISPENIERELDKLGFSYTLENGVFKATVPKRRLDIEPYVNDIAEEIGRLYGYENINSTLPVVPTKKGEYKGDVKLRKIVSKRLRALGLNETRTYTLVSPKESEEFTYEEKEKLVLPNPMSIDKSVVRRTLIPSLINVYNYNKKRKVKDIKIYEIAKTYDKNYIEDSKIAALINGNYIENKWNGEKIKNNFFVIKGILENLLDYLGFSGKYKMIQDNSIPNMHPYQSARVYLDKEAIGIIGKVHPNTSKDDLYVFEISLTKLIRNISPLKYKEATKYPIVEKDAAFIVDNDYSCENIIRVIKESSSTILSKVEVFDLYKGDNLGENKKSLAFHLTFSSNERTLTEDEVMSSFENIIENVCSKCNAQLRDK